MNILYLSQYFPPEVGATQTRAYEMGRGLVRAGHNVTMIAEVPNHPSGIIPPAYKGKLYERTDVDGIDVIRVWVKASPVKTFRNRMAFYLSYMLMAIVAGLFLARGKYDAIYATSPPLFVGGAALIISSFRRIPLFFEVRDLWPESAIILGELRNPGAIALAEWLEKACYRRARKIVVVTKAMYNKIFDRGYPSDKLAMIPNGANAELFQFQPEAGRALQKRLGLQNKFVVIYAGIHGLAQGLETVIKAATILADKRDIHFLFVGEGPVKPRMLKLASERHLTNITFHVEVPRPQMPAFFSAANVALVPLRRLDLFQGALPSKMFDAWACQCPTLITVDGEARQVLAEAEAGLFIEAENPEAMAEGILRLKNNPTACHRMGLNGRKAVLERYSREAQAKQLVDLLSNIIEKD
ncbi:MAG: glycosyltransferase family 4 protein [Deltaproteobacteria bacterium]|nr:glycosyltransferase family 4 protein [Deltaproteobacteria bacterium]